jgi:HAD superfamily hydrolase (TIGR01459 family)
MQQSLPKASSIIKISDLLDKYDLFLFDIWGVIIDGEDTYPDSAKVVNYLIDHKRVVFVSNVPRTINSTYEMLKGYNIKASPEMIVTSGDLAKRFLANTEQYLSIKNPLLYNLGLPRHSELWSGLDIDVATNIEKANLMLIAINVAQKDPRQNLYDLLEQAALLKIPAICANNDKIYANSSEIIYCAGHFAEKFEEFGGKVWYMGKPFTPIFEEALRKHPDIAKDKILMIGDTIDTDILGANNIGIDSALVTTGNVGFQVLSNQDKLTAIKNFCNTHGCMPSYIINLEL